MEQPLVSIVTVNYNGKTHTRDFLLSMQQVTYPAVEVFVVDNASSEPIDDLVKEFPSVKFILSKENLGFAGGNNLAIREAKGKYFFLINNDTEVEPGFLEPVVHLFETNAEIGIVSSRLIYHSDRSILQYAGSYGINMYTGRGFSIGYKEKDSEKYHVSYQTQIAHGAAMAFSREVVNTTGLMAELYFLYYEELDFCERVKKAGYKIWYCGESAVYHKESMSVGKESPMKTYYLTRNRIIFTRRNTSGMQKLLAMLFFTFISFPAGVLRYLSKKEFKLLGAFVKGAGWNLFHYGIFHNESLILK